MADRDRPFSSHEWRLFGVWLNYLDKALSIAYEVAEHGDRNTGDLGVSEAVTGVRWYATDLALLDALVFRAAGLRKDEAICFDQELSDFYQEFEADHPKLRDLRNALFAHPPFVDALVDQDEVLFFATDGVHITPAEGGRVETVIEPFDSHLRVPAMIEQVRAIITAGCRGDGRAGRGIAGEASRRVGTSDR